MQALVIVNLSTLDAYTQRFGREAGQDLADAIFKKIFDFDGPTYIIEQDWLVTEVSQPRMELHRALQRLMLRKDIKIIHFTEDQIPWKFFLEDVQKTLQKDGITEVVLGGLWYHPDEVVGAVSEAAEFLSPSFVVMIDEDISPRIPGSSMKGWER